MTDAEISERQREWLIRLVVMTGMSPTALAAKAGLAPTTLTRFMNSPQHATALSHRTVAAIEAATGFRFGDPALMADVEAPSIPDLLHQLAEKSGEIDRLREHLARRDRALRHVLHFLRELAIDDLTPFAGDDA